MNKFLKRRQCAQRLHFRRRVLERLGFAIPEEELTKVKNEIESGVWPKMASPIERLDIYRVMIGELSCVIIYDNETEELATFLTNSMWQVRKLAKAPAVTDNTALRGSVADTPAGKVLAGLKEK